MLRLAATHCLPDCNILIWPTRSTGKFALNSSGFFQKPYAAYSNALGASVGTHWATGSPGVDLPGDLPAPAAW